MKSRLFGVLLFIETAALLVTALVAYYYHVQNNENDYKYFLQTAFLTGVTGLVLYVIGRFQKKSFDSDDTFAIVSLSWIMFSLFGMLPFLLSDSIDNVTDAFFETISGFTTTGSTILDNVDEQSHGILFWRSVMQWLGGLGIVVFSIAFIPSVSKGSRKSSLFAAEAPGVSVEKLLWAIYIILTLICLLLYALGPMSFFDAVCHAMTTISTGGYSTHQESIGYFDSNYIEYVSETFMILSSVNFAMFYFLVLGRFDLIRGNEEVRVYLSSIIVMTLLFMGLFHFGPGFSGVTETQLANFPQNWRENFHVSFFHVVSMFSNTGFSGQNYNYDQWGLLFVIATLIMQIVGGCAGSASGGIKMVRVVVIYKVIRNALKELIHPTGMFSIKISGQNVDELTIRRVCSYLSFFILLLVINMLLLPLFGMSLEDAFAAFITYFSNLGVGSGATGPGAAVADLPTAVKWILSVDMLIGRLEIITLLLIFFRSTWVTTPQINR